MLAAVLSRPGRASWRKMAATARLQNRLMTTTTVKGSSLPVQNIFCIGRNFVEHAHELGNELPKEEPVVFLKSLSSLRGLEGYTAFADQEDEVHHELEVVVQMGTKVPFGKEAGWEAVSGLALGLDLTRRNKQAALKKKGLPWTLAKNFAGAGILGDFIDITKFDFEPPFDNLSFSLTVNGVIKQQASVGQMIFPVPHLITFLASYQSLEPGDIIFTGTPKGVGPIKLGDQFSMTWTNGIKAQNDGPLVFNGVI
mmetsp:Transcript_3429/g.8053  ORF Transcript_3429/g.8053 Transcript_3429/m.8053 type:complete len:254 (-) Transcript_3429:220-981(-)